VNAFFLGANPSCRSGVESDEDSDSNVEDNAEDLEDEVGDLSGAARIRWEPHKGSEQKTVFKEKTWRSTGILFLRAGEEIDVGARVSP
jgi:hypothetical protein